MLSNAAIPSTATSFPPHQPGLETSFTSSSPPLPAFTSPTASSDADRSLLALSASANRFPVPCDPLCAGRRDCPPHTSPSKSLAAAPSILAPTTTFNITSTPLEPLSGSSEVIEGREGVRRRLPDITLQSSIDAAKTAPPLTHDKSAHKYNLRMATHSEANSVEILALGSSTTPTIARVPSLQTSSIAHTMKMLAIVPPLSAPLPRSFPPRPIAVRSISGYTYDYVLWQFGVFSAWIWREQGIQGARHWATTTAECPLAIPRRCLESGSCVGS